MPRMQEVLDAHSRGDPNYPRGSTWRITDSTSDYRGCVVMLIYGPRLAVIHVPEECAAGAREDVIGATFSGTHNISAIEPVNYEVQDAFNG